MKITRFGLFGRNTEKHGDQSTDPDAPNPKETGSPQGTGCLGMVVQILVWVVSAALITIGAVLFLFGVLDFSRDARFASVFALFVVPLGIFLLLRIGRAILRDMKDKDPGD